MGRVHEGYEGEANDSNRMAGECSMMTQETQDDEIRRECDSYLKNSSTEVGGGEEKGGNGDSATRSQ